MKFLRNLLATLVGIFIAFFVILFIFIGIATVASSEEEIIVAPNSILKIQLDAEIKDYSPREDDFFANLFGKSDDFVGLNSIVNAIENAKNDSNIKGISIQPILLSGGISQIKAIRKAVESFKESGKFVMAYGDFYGQKEYYLSSIADSLYLSPVGSVDFKGLASEVLFFKDFQDAYGFKMEVIRHGKYKSAVEPFLENKMSPSNRKQLEELLHSIWADIAQDISIQRNISSEKLNELADDLKGRTSKLALENLLVDAIVYEDAYLEKLKTINDNQDFSTINLLDYIKTGKDRIYKSSSNKIAVLYAQGDIIYGNGDEDNVGQILTVDALEEIANDDAVKALVLRVNSPGGSALASDLIWRAVEKVKEKKKVVVSMGDYAASGGYYIACNADKIVAEPSTITGSIGVFGMVPNISGFTDKIGIHSDRVATNSNASYSVFQPMNSNFYKVTKEGVDLIYKTFVSKVAEGRGMTFEQVHELAQGRVWSGKQAQENGLVDVLGGLDVAIETAAEMLELEDYKLVNYPSYEKDIREAFKNVPFLGSKESLLKEFVGNENFALYQQLESLKNSKGIQARIPYVLDIK